MEIIIGRNQQTRQLSILKDGTTTNYGQLGSVPMDVSRHHISLQPQGDGKWLVKNLNERNVTFVNGISIETKTISNQDKVELGNSHYLFPWESLNNPTEEVIDIRPLQKIWNEYDRQCMELDIAERKFNAARSAAGVITMIAIACSFILGHGPIYLLLYAAAIGISIAFAIQAYNNAAAVPYKRKEIKKDFQRKYICPKCNTFMGYQDYDLLSQKDSCPNCRTKIKK